MDHLSYNNGVQVNLFLTLVYLKPQLVNTVFANHIEGILDQKPFSSEEIAEYAKQCVCSW